MRGVAVDSSSASVRVNPWIPIFAVMTLVAGAVLWIRKPRPQRWSRRGPEDDAVLEEIEG